MNYNNKKFRIVKNSENGETTEEMIFEYKQNGNILTSEYSGGRIVNAKGELMTGICFSNKKTTPNGKIRLYEDWEWTSGDLSRGKSILEEL